MEQKPLWQAEFKSGIEVPCDLAAQPGNHACPRQRHQGHLSIDARLEAHRSSRRHVQPETTRRRPIKLQRRIRLRKVKVRADLNRSIARIHDGQHKNFAPSIQLQRTITNDDLAGNH